MKGSLLKFIFSTREVFMCIGFVVYVSNHPPAYFKMDDLIFGRLQVCIGAKQPDCSVFS